MVGKREKSFEKAPNMILVQLLSFIPTKNNVENSTTIQKFVTSFILI